MRRATMMWRLIAISALPLALVGFDVGLVSAAIRGMRIELELNELQESVAASATYIVGAFGGLYCGHLADRYGRRNAVLIAVALVVFGTAVAASSPGPICVVFGRSVLGIGCGLLQAVTPILLAEIAPASKRGFSVACAEVMITGGNVLGAFVGFIFCESKGGWRTMFLMNSVAGVACLIFFYLQLPESPRWIAAKGKTTEALALLIPLVVYDLVNANLRKIWHSGRRACARPFSLCEFLDRSTRFHAMRASVVWVWLSLAARYATCRESSRVYSCILYVPTYSTR